MDKLLNIFQIGGVMMIPLTALAVAAIIISLERFFYLHKGQIRAQEFVDGIKAVLKKKRLLEAITICDEGVGPIPRIVKTALINSEQSVDVMSQSVNAAALNEFAQIDKRVASIALIAKIAPLMGLMGTIISLLQIFHTMAQSGDYATASDFSAYVFSALLSTAFGLLIAIFGWISYSFLNGRVRAIAQDMDLAGNDIVLFIARKMPEDENLYIKGADKK